MEQQIIREGQTVRTEPSCMSCTTEKLLGAGGQGEVYKATLGGEAVALKWFFPQMATPEQRAAIELLVRKGAPSEHFLWPIELAVDPNVQGFGYVMGLRPARFKNIVDLMKRRIEPTFRALATACFNLAHNYLLLHSQGFCYRDISFGNAFFDPDNGDVLICDCDNVAVNGGGTLGVLGTPRFMAPEVVRGEAVPSTETDLFSLAVLIFYMLTVSHPLEGKKETEIKCLDLPAMNKLYGTEPIFIYDPQDESNSPVAGIHDNALAFWRIYPQFLHDIFTRAFTVGLRDPRHGRVRESEWRGQMVRLRDTIFYCPHCSLENFYDADKLKASGGNPGLCWSCAAQLKLPPRIRIGQHIVMLNHDTQIFPHHVDDGRLYDFSQAVASVAQHPTNKDIWGLKNLTDEKWVVTTADGDVRDVEANRSVTLSVGTRIHFGEAEGEIRL
ncbi:MAG: serine/threonine protein kinase [Acidobacteriota bacterium]|nr:serine/threonine protein kinase [Acidobacteriota bacterium]